MLWLVASWPLIRCAAGHIDRMTRVLENNWDPFKVTLGDGCGTSQISNMCRFQDYSIVVNNN